MWLSGLLKIPCVSIQYPVTSQKAYVVFTTATAGRVLGVIPFRCCPYMYQVKWQHLSKTCRRVQFNWCFLCQAFPGLRGVDVKMLTAQPVGVAGQQRE